MSPSPDCLTTSLYNVLVIACVREGSVPCIYVFSFWNEFPNLLTVIQALFHG